MSLVMNKPNFLEDLSPEQQQLLSGGQFNNDEEMNDDEINDFDDEESFDTPPRERRKRVRRIPIRLTGVLQVLK